MHRRRFDRLIIPCAAALAGLVMPPALAHHSFAPYDMSRTLTTQGTIKKFRWSAPHSSAVITITQNGAPADLVVISAPPYAFTKQGFKLQDFHPGDKVTISSHPNHSGYLGGALAGLQLPDGRRFVDSNGDTLLQIGPPAKPAP